MTQFEDGCINTGAQIQEENYLGQFIPLQYHHQMLMDQYRMSGFKAAIDLAVFPGAKVLELGGGTGVLSWFAAAKADKVWCVEFNPDLVREARRFFNLNQGSEKIELVHADAFNYLPPEPVDVVICEMLYPALLSEKQVELINSFKERYLQRFGGPLPRFIPEAVILGVQPLQQDFHFMGYYAPIMQFQPARPTKQETTTELAAPQVYSTVDFTQPVSEEVSWKGVLTLEQTGQVNALRFITKSILAISTDDNSFIEWHTHYMTLPLAEPIHAEADACLHISFNYRAGGPLSQLQNSIIVSFA